KQSYQYVAMYNVNNNFAMMKSNPLGSQGWNKTKFNLELADHTVKAIARPNNDTYYIISMLDLRDDAVVINYPAFDTKYASLEVSGYDHYITIPIATSKGDFKEETSILYYSDRTKNYKGEAIEGVHKSLKMTSDFVIAFLRVAAHETKDGRNVKALDNFKLTTLSEFQGKEAVQTTTVEFPAWGNDQMVFKNNFLETMQFVFNHISLDLNNEMDKAILESMKKLGVQPGKEFDPAKVAELDGKRVAEIAKKVFDEALVVWNSPDGNPYLFQVFLPKGEMNLDAMVTQSAVGPIGLPASEAVYPGIGTASGEPLNAMNDYVIKMTRDELPPADAFWSITLYDTKNGFLIPNDRFKYIVGENGGMQLNEDGGIEIYIAQEKPTGVPEDNWLPINREDIDLDMIMRIYAPRVDDLKNYSTPKAEKL
ncbi:MAG: DUF1214 domain-containing protein, partial [Eudoraea sp.]|uniref:DUF1214 domain-containing protein n=1 Tax=Eudoraea sp. TaxID=1979955 RepID=UPI003C73AB08